MSMTRTVPGSGLAVWARPFLAFAGPARTQITTTTSRLSADHCDVPKLRPVMGRAPSTLDTATRTLHYAVQLLGVDEPR